LLTVGALADLARAGQFAAMATEVRQLVDGFPL
jgi:hypothetical protein